MRGHLRADIIRLRGRWDAWAFLVAVPVLAALGFLEGYVNVRNNFGWADPSQPMPPEIVAAMAFQRATYAFPHSLLLVLGSTPWVLFAAFFLVSTTIGLEFGWGTLRTSLVVSPDRARLLASRALAVGAIGVVLLVALLVLGVALPQVLPLTGETPPPSPDVAPVVVAGAVAAALVSLAFWVALAALLAVVSRGPSLPFLLVLVYFLVEGVTGGLAIWRDAGLQLVSGSLPFASVMALISGSTDPSHYGLAAADPSAFDRPLPVSFAVVAGWTALFFVAAIVRLRRIDVRE
jgi:ABC-type transport system involved in multi-copper enzyme maturation permease subunit